MSAAKKNADRDIPGCDKRGLKEAVAAKVQAYCRPMGEPNHRYLSWVHCYNYFRRQSPPHDLDQDAIHLGFFLASWGMYRASSFLLQLDYAVHKDAISALRSPDFVALWAQDFDFGADHAQSGYKETILDAANAVRDAYAAHAPRGRSQVSDTLVTKVILSVLGCLPACDRYFIGGFRECFAYSGVNSRFVDRVFSFCCQNRKALQQEQRRIQRRFSVHYPLMKLVDMYFWQIGCEKEHRSKTP